MKEGYIPKDQRKTILMLSDDIRTHSGVGNMAKEIIKEVPVEKIIEKIVEVEKPSKQQETSMYVPPSTPKPKGKPKLPGGAWGNAGGAR